MPSAQRSPLARLGEYFGVDDPWERPRPEVSRSDVLLLVGFEVLGLVLLELVRSVGILKDVPYPWWVQWLAVSTAALLLVGRRRWPVTVGLLAAAHMLAVGLLMPVVMGQFTLQVMYFIAFLSAVSWARDRRWMLVAVGIIVIVMFAWIALQYAIGTGIQEMADDLGSEGAERSGLLGPIPAAILLTVFVNVIYFGGAIIGGQASWRSARQKALLAAQAQTIADQGETLRDQAVTEERLRIARELHDVVGHHVAAIGVQAAAARRTMHQQPASAEQALASVERSSRDAVTQMRGLLGTLRDLEGRMSEPTRTTDPGLGDLDSLGREYAERGLAVTVHVVGEARDLPAQLSLTAYRIIQEALANVTKHSTATSATVTVRHLSQPDALEVEVLDGGSPRGRSSGSGLGHLGIRERVAAHHGEIEIGPRVTGGFRVRARLPLGESHV